MTNTGVTVDKWLAVGPQVSVFVCVCLTLQQAGNLTLKLAVKLDNGYMDGRQILLLLS